MSLRYFLAGLRRGWRIEVGDAERAEHGGVVVVALAAVLTRCATKSGPPLSSLATVGGPQKGMARIAVVRQEKGLLGLRDASFTLKLDGEPLGELLTSTLLIWTAEQDPTNSRPSFGVGPA